MAQTEQELFGVDLRGFPTSASRSDRLHLC
ncbi:MAG: hypothetical protein MUP04_04810, partial [Anaerolineae bacterium]|nr:hypothetical protein [Anaerolineae bacterium]